MYIMYNTKTWLDCLQLTGVVPGVGGGRGGSDDDGLGDQRTLNSQQSDCQSNITPALSYLRLQQGLVRATAPAEEEEDKDESEEDVEHDDQGEQGVGDQRQAAIPVVGGHRVVGVGLLYPGQGEVVDERVREDDMHGSVWCCRLQPPATSVVFPLSQCPHCSAPTILRDTISTPGPYTYCRSSSFI